MITEYVPFVQFSQFIIITQFYYLLT